MVAALAIFRLVVDGAALNLDLAGRKITLEILHIRSSIPEAPLLEREQFQLFHFLRLISQREFLHLGPFL